MEALPESVYVGWDVAITDQGPVVIEANANPHVDLLQCHGPFLANDPRVLNFYYQRGAVPHSSWRRLNRNRCETRAQD